MRKLAIAILMISSPAFAQSGAVDCSPIGQTAQGEMVYGLDCKLGNRAAASTHEPKMPDTNLPETVIPQPNKVQNPDTTPTTGQAK